MSGQTATQELLPCPFCNRAVQFRKALHVSDGNDDGIMHAEPSRCPMSHFADGSTDESIIAKWNTRAPSRDAAEGAGADDPTSSAQWNEGCDFAMTQLCTFLGVDPAAVSWDAATETVDGDARAVIGNILRAKYGEDWGPQVQPADSHADLVKALEDLQSAESAYRMIYDSDGYYHQNTLSARAALRSAGYRARAALATLTARKMG